MTTYRGAVNAQPSASLPKLAILLDDRDEVVFSVAVKTLDEGEALLEKIKRDFEAQAKHIIRHARNLIFLKKAQRQPVLAPAAASLIRHRRPFADLRRPHCMSVY